MPFAFSGSLRFISLGNVRRDSTLASGISKLAACSTLGGLAVDRQAEPTAGIGPVVFRGGNRDVEGFGDLLVGQAGEEAQLDHVGFALVLSGEFFQGLAQSEDFVVGGRKNRLDVRHVDANAVAAGFKALPV